MKVILLQNIKSLGNKYDIKNVSDGYARNFLFPKKLAEIAAEQKIKELIIQKENRGKKEQETKIKLEAIAKDLSNKKFQFTIKTGEKGEVFGSINKDDIKTQIFANTDAKTHKILKDIEVNLERPIKILGERQVEINLGNGIKMNIIIEVEADKREISNNIKAD